jgi:hypothetical protein
MTKQEKETIIKQVQGSYISQAEITCKCGCGFSNLNPQTIRIFNLIREKMGKPIVVKSACRCHAYNKKVGGKPNSAHLPDANGMSHALDIEINNSSDRFFIAYELMQLGIKRIGAYETFIHFDCSKSHPQKVLWLTDAKS